MEFIFLRFIYDFSWRVLMFFLCPASCGLVASSFAEVNV